MRMCKRSGVQSQGMEMTHKKADHSAHAILQRHVVISSTDLAPMLRRFVMTGVAQAENLVKTPPEQFLSILGQSCWALATKGVFNPAHWRFKALASQTLVTEIIFNPMPWRLKSKIHLASLLCIAEFACVW